MNYVLTLNDKQAHHLIAAIDLYTRMHLGQLEELASVLPSSHPVLKPPCEGFRTALGVIKTEYLNLAPNASKGISHGDLATGVKIAYDIESVLRAAVAKTEKHEVWSTWHGPPLHLGAEPLATVNDQPLQEKK